MSDASSQDPAPRGAERRKAPRAPAVVRVEYSTVDDFFSEFTQNINEGGMFIETDTPSALDSLVQLQFALPGSNEPVKATGRVVHVVGPGQQEPPGMGVQFEELDDHARSQLSKLVQRLRTGPRSD